MSRKIAAKPSLTLSEQELNIRNTDFGKLIVTKYQEKNVALYLYDGKLIDAYFFSHTDSSKSNVGDIYIGKVKSINNNIDACFVEISKEEICFLPMKNASSPILLNREYDGRLIAGDELLIEIQKEAQKTKQAVATGKVSLEDEVIAQCRYKKCFTCVKKNENNVFQSVLAYFAKDNYAEIVTDVEEYVEPLTKATSNTPQKVCVRLYQDKMLSLNGLYGLESKLKEALERRIWLKSGGYLVIDITEALTVIDVNSGKFEAKKEAEESRLRINLEAAKEIARQIRLRNLSGIIIIDFINLKDKENQKHLTNELKEWISADPTKTIFVDMTALGLVEITRKKVRKTLAEQFKNV